MTDMTRRSALATGLASGLAAGALTAPAAAASNAEGQWVTRAALPYVTQEIYCTVWRGRIVTAGGLDPKAPGVALDRSAIYDPAADAWTEGPKLPAPRHHPQIIAAGDRVYAMGGYGMGNGGFWSSRTDIFAFDGSAWTPAGQMPAPQAETVTALLGDRVHMVGGRAPRGEANAQWDDQGDIDIHRVFDPASGKWELARPAPQAANSAACAVIDGALYLVAGRTVEGGNIARLDRYDPETDRWTSLAPLPQGSGGLAAASMGGKLYAFGGEWFTRDAATRTGGVYAEAWCYDPKADHWRAIAPMKTPRHGLAAATIGERIFAVAGAARMGGSETTNLLEAWEA
ncbi:MAG: Kelch repeat-containing protein [Caulobacter sp.]